MIRTGDATPSKNNELSVLEVELVYYGIMIAVAFTIYFVIMPLISSGEY